MCTHALAGHAPSQTWTAYVDIGQVLRPTRQRKDPVTTFVRRQELQAVCVLVEHLC